MERRGRSLVTWPRPAHPHPSAAPAGVFRCNGATVRTVARYGGGLLANPGEPRINEKIRSPRVRLIGVDGSQLGIFNTPDAQRIADDQNLDLVEVAPNSDPPVARIMDYGKYRYEEAIKAKLARKHQTTIQVKEIKFRPKIDKHDYETKKKHVIRFIESGAKVKVTIMFRGREMVHAERGLAILERLAEDLGDTALIENQPKIEGRNMFMLIAPTKKDLPVKGKKKAGEDEVAEETRETPTAAPSETGEAAKAEPAETPKDEAPEAESGEASTDEKAAEPAEQS